MHREDVGVDHPLISHWHPLVYLATKQKLSYQSMLNRLIQPKRIDILYFISACLTLEQKKKSISLELTLLRTHANDIRMSAC